MFLYTVFSRCNSCTCGHMVLQNNSNYATTYAVPCGDILECSVCWNRYIISDRICIHFYECQQWHQQMEVINEFNDQYWHVLRVHTKFDKEQNVFFSPHCFYIVIPGRISFIAQDFFISLFFIVPQFRSFPVCSKQYIFPK